MLHVLRKPNVNKLTVAAVFFSLVGSLLVHRSQSAVMAQNKSHGKNIQQLSLTLMLILNPIKS